MSEDYCIVVTLMDLTPMQLSMQQRCHGTKFTAGAQPKGEGAQENGLNLHCGE